MLGLCCILLVITFRFVCFLSDTSLLCKSIYIYIYIYIYLFIYLIYHHAKTPTIICHGYYFRSSVQAIIRPYIIANVSSIRNDAQSDDGRNRRPKLVTVVNYLYCCCMTVYYFNTCIDSGLLFNPQATNVIYIWSAHS